MPDEIVGMEGLQAFRQFRAELEAENPAFRGASDRGRRAKAFAERSRDDLRAFRIELHLEQTDLANAVGYSQSAISKVEKGQTELTLVMLYRLADAMGLRPVVSFVPAARVLASGSLKRGSPEHERAIEIAQAIESAQVEMLRRMPHLMDAMAKIVRAEAQGDPSHAEAAQAV